ncbi:His-Xaa-Ser system radical SAM maturase HxsC [Lutibacter sp. HS1-25]|uniref:His-Xaa-Ser system radical SAM maturase HxsC n=1 Tax=Lutibacter sp. HS1-25 TaxID=2485000 RepID=UPI0013E983AA|nr:His-Xaa-Ser system radical SAM maturase HxsC [Lutibacter sp. HS1-25]
MKYLDHGFKIIIETFNMIAKSYIIGVVEDIDLHSITLKNKEGFLIKIEVTSENFVFSDYFIRPKKFSKLSVSKLDIIKIEKRGGVKILFKHGSNDNLLFVTDQCNSSCLMCSQPPKNVDDIEYFYKINNEILSLIPKDIEVIGISGGEPTLLGEKLNLILKRLKLEFPNTRVHILSNGRKFFDKNYVSRLSLDINKLATFGIPLYSDIATIHDYVVQAKNAFYQTAIGLHNAARFGLNIEIRIVITKLNYERLPKLAKYIFMNYPFVEHVAFMGVEYTGFAVVNSELIKVNPDVYMDQLKEAVLFLNSMKINTSIYNLPLCLVHRKLWPFSVKSISDWKQEYSNDCKLCEEVNICGGFFRTSRLKYNNINPILEKKYNE